MILRKEMEYFDLGHAEPLPSVDKKKLSSVVYYLPMHGVVKELSTTTKFRIVFDASAPSTSGCSLNDTLLPGPLLRSFSSFELTLLVYLQTLAKYFGLAPEFVWRKHQSEHLKEGRIC